MDGTIALCSELGVDPEDVGLLALAYELKSPSPGEWARKGWVDGLKALGVDNLDAFRTAVATLASKLRTDAAYFSKVRTLFLSFLYPPRSCRSHFGYLAVRSTTTLSRTFFPLAHGPLAQRRRWHSGAFFSPLHVLLAHGLRSTMNGGPSI